MHRCKLCLDDFRRLAEASAEGMLPKLRDLDISWNSDLRPALTVLLGKGFPKLNSLIAQFCCLNWRDLRSLAAANVAGKLPCLTTLDLSRNPHITGFISILLTHCFPHLTVLILRNCQLTEKDSSSIQQANADGKIPQLKLLDISQNPVGYGYGHKSVSTLLIHHFPSLAYLVLCRCGLNDGDLESLAQAKLAGKLPALKYLDVSLNGLTGHLSHLTRDPRTGYEIFWDRIVCVEARPPSL